MNTTRVNRPRLVAVVIAAALAAGAVLATVGSGASAAPQATQAKYSAILLNPFIGNDWRPQMQKYASVAVKKPPLNAKISGVRIVTTQNNDPNLQAPALQSAILDKPDIIVMIAASQTATNGLIQRACSKGILVVGFDTFPTAPCAWKLGPDWVAVGRTWADWIARSVGGSGKVLVDRGEPGTSSADGIKKGVDKVFKKYPGIKVIEYISKYSPGEETKAVSQLLASNSDIKGIISLAYAAQESLKKAGLKIPATGFNYPTAMSGCLANKVPCLLVGVPPWISAEALKLAVDIKEGRVKGSPRYVPFRVPLFRNLSNVKPTTTNLGQLYELKTQFTAKTPKGAFLPVSPPWVKINFKEIAG